MNLTGKSSEFLKKLAHRLPKRLFRLANETFEVTRGFMGSLGTKPKRSGGPVANR